MYGGIMIAHDMNFWDISGVQLGTIMRVVSLVFAAIAVVFAGGVGRGNEPTAAEKLFALQVKPLLADKCFSCHGDDPDKIKGDLSLLTRADMLKGGEYSDKVLVPGSAEESDLYVAVTWEDEELEMPP